MSDPSRPIVFCPRCGEPYYFQNMTVRDQSMCPICRAKAEQRIAAREPKKTGDVFTAEFGINHESLDR